MTNDTSSFARLLKSVSLLTAAALIGKVFSAVYRIPYQNMTGDIGYYVYQQVYPFYGIAMILALYGFPAVLAGEMVQQKKASERLETMKAAGVVLAAAGALAFVFLFLFAPVAAGAMGDGKLTPVLRVASFVFLLVPVLSLGRGYYQGRGRMEPTALSHVVEQVCRVSFILLFAWAAVSAGQGVYDIGAGAMGASIAGAGAGALILLLLWWSQHRSKSLSFRFRGAGQEYKIMMKKLLVPGVVACLGAMVFLFYQWIDAFTVVPGLEAYGISGRDAKETKGVLDRAQPLLQFGTVVSTALAAAVLPSLQGKEGVVLGGLALRISLVIGGAAAVGLYTVAGFVNVMLFENSRGTDLMAVLAISLLFSGWIVTANAILQGGGRVRMAAGSIVAGGLIKLVGNVVLIPAFGAIGAAAATIIGLAVTSLLQGALLQKHRLVSWPSIRWCACLGALLVLLGAGLWVLQLPAGSVDARTVAGMWALGLSGAGLALCLALVKGLRLFERREWNIFSAGGNKNEKRGTS
ncbi:polysaccharide biosynthesis protein [Marinococcus sp. PL1-022]|jgi:PST family polysaccharide transporter|uniref:polysaccharide biosynthesis protein n=1 Tax=Marinococcus sp. PL1-022 TaxID=3095363 RepID=UPI0029C1DDE2|nr:polysaccharide biosynthesis protein [Marinococcus sp. PL1-022]MDX6154441.1 polysaccharide biosynthesis protein [Marinococcus sp. PL1-022]